MESCVRRRSSELRDEKTKKRRPLREYANALAGACQSLNLGHLAGLAPSDAPE